MPDPTASEHHTPPDDATCPTRWAALGVAHACRWISHEGGVHKCVCGDLWNDDAAGCRAVPVTADDLEQRIADRVGRVYDRSCASHTARAAMIEVAPELERLRAELANRDLLLAKHRETVGVIVGQREEAKAERDLLRETLAESDLGAQVLAQWEAIAAADADRDRLEAERDALKAAAEWGREALEGAVSAWTTERDFYQERAGRKGYSHDEAAAEAYGTAIKAVTGILAALAAPESHEETDHHA